MISGRSMPSTTYSATPIRSTFWITISVRSILLQRLVDHPAEVDLVEHHLGQVDLPERLGHHGLEVDLVQHGGDDPVEVDALQPTAMTRSRSTGPARA